MTDYYPSNYQYENQGYPDQPYSYNYEQGGEYPSPDLGQMSEVPVTPGSSYGQGTGFEEEPPLLEELGINFDHIKNKTKAVLNPFMKPDNEIATDTDLAGPLVFCLLFGGVLLVSGKIHFGYIYGVGLLGCLSMYTVLNLMSQNGVSAVCVMSILGYCLLPMVLLSACSLLITLQGILGLVLSILIIVWCSYAASNLFVLALSMHDQQLLVAYPCALLYGVFVLLTIF